MEIGERMLLMMNKRCYSDAIYTVRLKGENERMTELIWTTHFGKIDNEDLGWIRITLFEICGISRKMTMMDWSQIGTRN